MLIRREHALWKGIVVSVALHAALLWALARSGPIRMPPRDRIDVIIVNMVSVPLGLPSGMLTAGIDSPVSSPAVTALKPPSAAVGTPPAMSVSPPAAPEPRAVSRRPAGLVRKMESYSAPKEELPPVQSEPSAEVLKDTTGLGNNEPPSNSVGTEGDGSAKIASLPPGGAGQQTGTGSAGTSGGLGAFSGPVAFGSINGPKFQQRIPPRYPPRALSMGREGTVVLRLTIDEQGKLVNVEVVQSAGFGFDEEAVHAVRDSSCRPAIRDGMPATSIAELPVRFVLKPNDK